MDRFSEIIGQDMAVSHLQSALRSGGVSHAYILNGAKGSGRHMIARSFSAALLCEDPQMVRRDGAGHLQAARESVAGSPQAARESTTERLRMMHRGGAGVLRSLPPLIEPCGQCLSCIQAASGSNPDIITLRPEKEASIGVGDIRKMRADVQVMPYRAAHKVYIVPDAEKMTPAAQNALLKTLEEPPPYAVLLLLADGTSNFLPTIMSRCVTLPLRPVSEASVEDCLISRFGADSERARLCARFSSGSIGKAALLLEDEAFAALRDQAAAFMRGIEEADASGIALLAKEAAEGGRAQELIDFVLTWIRDLLVCRSTHRTESLIFTDEVQYIIEAAKKRSWTGLQAAAEAVFRARRRLASNVNAELTLQMMFLEIRAACEK